MNEIELAEQTLEEVREVRKLIKIRKQLLSSASGASDLIKDKLKGRKINIAPFVVKGEGVVVNYPCPHGMKRSVGSYLCSQCPSFLFDEVKEREGDTVLFNVYCGHGFE
jgi:hypothetical protein